MANLYAKFEERNSNDASTSCSGIIDSFSYVTTSESYGSIHELGAANDWTFEEQAILDDLLVRYSSESTISRYAKIASQLGNKTIRDVAMRCRWMSKKEIGKRRKEDLKPLRRVKEKKESVDMATKSTSSLFALSPKFIIQDGITNELLKQNEDLHKQIYGNLAYLKFEENIELLSKSRENLKKLMKKLDDDEWMKNMPPLPVMLNEQLADIILPPSYPTKQLSVRSTSFDLYFDLGFTGDFCSGLLVDYGGELLLPADTLEACKGVPEYPLYKRLSLGLLKSIASGSFCGTFQKLSLVKEIEKEWDKLTSEKCSELVNALKDIACELHVPEPLFLFIKDGLKTVEARCFEAEFDRLRRKGSMVLINNCLMFEVQKVNQFSSFNELLQAESLEKVFLNTKTVEEGLQMLRTLYDVEQEKINGVIAIHLTKTFPQPCATLAQILSGLSYSGVRSLLGLSQTIGSILDSLPPPKSMLLSSFMLPYKPKIKGCRLSHGARALAKHVDRSSDGFWGVLHGTDLDKNRVAEEIVNEFLENCCWMNLHIVPPHGDVFEIRVANGYGARWSKDGTKFIGFLEPYMENGHSMAWKH